MHSPEITAVRFTPSSPADVAAGLVGFVALDLGGTVHLDGIAVRRTRQGRLCLSYPRRRRGLPPSIQPLDRKEFEAAVLAKLAEQGVLSSIADRCDGESQR